MAPRPRLSRRNLFALSSPTRKSAMCSPGARRLLQTCTSSTPSSSSRPARDEPEEQWPLLVVRNLRYDVMKKFTEIQLSQNYLFFWDNLNKANYFLELCIYDRSTTCTSSTISFLTPIYPESTHSSLSLPLNELLKLKLREYKLVLHSLHSSLRAASPALAHAEVVVTLCPKEGLLEVYTFMSVTLGVPPSAEAAFVWDYDKDGKDGS
ncbi:hypothetical protein FA95DRAFT_1679912 [Auriscalpium vulgare]|uniref:Uncharacterized protein n=1 Tax=Auriscalpium vulgare TaxID=40419 RepID=A0ACB8RQ84_9AGAM|nr:hypothetical protein FA95DRAFT_1679912 [Auriscalpium vulgare]